MRSLSRAVLLIFLVLPVVTKAETYRVTVEAGVAPSSGLLPSDIATRVGRDCRVPALPATGKPGQSQITVFVKEPYFRKFFTEGRLLRLIRQQGDVPRALVLVDGDWTLGDLAALHGGAVTPDGTLLMPLLIGPRAVLRVSTGQTLVLSGERGAFIINLGWLDVRNAVLRGTSDGGEFRSFVLGWGGSTTVIDGSKVSGLGFAENLSDGLRFAAGPQDLRDIDGSRSAHAWIMNSHFTGMHVAIRATGGVLQACNNVIAGSRHRGIQVEGTTSTTLSSNRVTGTLKSAAVALDGSKSYLVAGGEISDNFQSGLVISGGRGVVSGLRADRNTSDALRIEDGALTLLNYVASSNGQHAIHLRGSADLRAYSIQADSNHGMGIVAELRQPENKPGAAAAGGYLLLSGARLQDNAAGAIGLEIPWRASLSDVAVKVTTHEHRQVFRGDLNAVEAEVLKSLLPGGGVVRIVPPPAATGVSRPSAGTALRAAARPGK